MPRQQSLSHPNLPSGPHSRVYVIHDTGVELHSVFQTLETAWYQACALAFGEPYHKHWRIFVRALTESPTLERTGE